MPYYKVIFPIITASFAPVTLGILLGFPEIVSLARIAKARASLALDAMPKSLIGYIFMVEGR